MRRFVLDTNLYVRATRDPAWAEEMAAFIARHLSRITLHAVVAQEVLAGAVDGRRERDIERALIRPFARRGRLLTPGFGEWKRAGLVVARLAQKRLISRNGFTRSFTNDCLLAASCRAHGCSLITSNLRDFSLIRQIEPVEILAPWPS